MVLSALLFGAADAHVPVIYITNATEDWCGVIDQALGGDIVMLEPGEYLGPCEVAAKASDLPGEQTILQSLDPGDLAVLRPGPGADHVLGVSGDRLILLQLDFRGIVDGIEGVRVGETTELWLRWSRFEGGGGVGLSQIGDVQELYVASTEFLDVARPLQLGCADGSCAALRFQVDDSLVVGADEAIRIGPGSEGTVRDTMITASTGVGLRLMGGRSAEVERSLVEGAVIIEAGPAILQSNLLLGGLVASGPAIAEVDLLGNTVLGDVDLDGWGAGRGLRFVDNALDRDVPAVGGGESEGNVACLDLDACFVDAAAWDFYPSPDSVLRTAGVAAPDLVSDWCQRVRQSPPTSGALEGYGPLSMGSIAPTFKDLVDCSLPDPADTAAVDTGSSPDSGDTAAPPPDPESPEGSPSRCGCSEAPPVLPTWLLGVAVLLRRRRDPIEVRRPEGRCTWSVG